MELRAAAAIAFTLLALAVVGGVFALTHDHGAAQDASTADVYRGSEPPTGLRIPAFRLTSYRGQGVRSSDLRGKVIAVTFLDTACTESCPVIAGVIGLALPRLSASDRAHVEAIALSVDPQVDTPRRVRRFLRRRGAFGTLDFLTGPLDGLRRAWHAFHVVPAVETGNADVHSADLRIFDFRGVWVSTLHPGVDLTPSNLAHDLRTALERS
jgi:protein SCO1